MFIVVLYVRFYLCRFVVLSAAIVIKETLTIFLDVFS